MGILQSGGLVNKIKDIGRGVINLVFPPRCPVCDGIIGPVERYIHSRCCEKLFPVEQPQCMRCGKPVLSERRVSEAEKKSAVDAMVKLTENAQMEEDAQMMLEAKGFKNAVVSLSDECCDVIVGKDDVTDEKRAQIEDIIKRKTNIGASNIVISTMD